MHTITKTDKGYDITLTRGDSLVLQINLKKNGTAYTPVSPASVRFAMKGSYEDAETVLEKSVPINTMLLEFEPNDTKDLPMGKKYVYDIELTDENSRVDTFISGKFIIDKEVK